jgi:predicted NAD/FAD-binding protein
MVLNSQSNPHSLRIAIVGSGIAGMATAWLLSKAHQVTVYEKEDRLGGHSNTVEIKKKQQTISIDTGFIVYNEVNYPNLTKLFEHLKVSTQKSDMSFSVSLNGGKLEYGSRNLNAMLGQRSNIFRGRFWRMIKDIQLFRKHSEEYLTGDIDKSRISLRQFLSQKKYSNNFVKHFILPMGAAIWSTKIEDILEQPATTFLRFFASHGLMKVRNRITWRTVVGGSSQYIKKLTANYLDKVRIGQAVRSVTRYDQHVEVVDENGKVEIYDAIVLATHADQTLDILSDPDSLELSLLGAFKYTDNHVVLHSDPNLMPNRRQVWSSWNFMGSDDKGVHVTYWMNSLQSIDRNIPLFVSVNPNITPDKSRIYKSFNYEHPVFDHKAWHAQKCLWQIQNYRNTWYCGSYFGYGFHEDALQSGLAVAEELGKIKRPWNLINNSYRINLSSINQDIAA